MVLISFHSHSIIVIWISHCFFLQASCSCWISSFTKSFVPKVNPIIFWQGRQTHPTRKPITTTRKICNNNNNNTESQYYYTSHDDFDINDDVDNLPNLKLLIPAYNEESRIKETLQSYDDFFAASPWNCEIIVISDGSTDNTATVVNSLMPNSTIPISCISLPHNQGKGAALAKGIEHVATTTATSITTIQQQQQSNDNEKIIILTLDADGSGELIYLNTMFQSLKLLLLHCDDKQDNNDNCQYDWSKPVMVIGNRNYSFFTARGITRWGFQTAVKLFAGNLRVQDSQCGYKLMTLSAGQVLYKNLNLKRWSHDVEVLYRATKLDLPIFQIPIEWKDKDGSKVVASGVVKVSAEMLWDVIRMRWHYEILKDWSYNTKED